MWIALTEELTLLCREGAVPLTHETRGHLLRRLRYVLPQHVRMMLNPRDFYLATDGGSLNGGSRVVVVTPEGEASAELPRALVLAIDHAMSRSLDYAIKGSRLVS